MLLKKSGMYCDIAKTFKILYAVKLSCLKDSGTRQKTLNITKR